MSELITPRSGEWQAAQPSRNQDTAMYRMIDGSDNNRAIKDWQALRNFLHHEGTEGKLRYRLMRSPNVFARAIATSSFNSDNILPEYMGMLNIKSKPTLDIKPVIGVNDWNLCSTSEARTLKAIDESATVFIGGLLVKFNGRTTALCVESFVTQTGTFIAGNYYSPDRPTQLSLREAFIEGDVNPGVPDSNWLLIRSVRRDNIGGLRLLDAIRKKKIKRFKEYPDKLNRRAYINKEKEEYVNFKGRIVNI